MAPLPKSKSPNGNSEFEAIVAALIAGARYGIKIRLPHAFVMTLLFKRQLTAKEKLKTILKLTFEHASNLASFAFLYKSILAILKYTSKRLNSSELSGNKFHLLGRAFLVLILDGKIQSSLSIWSSSSNPCNSKNNGNVEIETTELTLLESAPPGIPQHPFHSLIAGLIGGYTIWGRYSSVNYQIVLYLTSRVMAGLMTLGVEMMLHDSGSGSSLESSTSSLSLSNSKWLTFDKVYPLIAGSIWGTVMIIFETYPQVLHSSLKRSMDEVYREMNILDFIIGRRGDGET